MTKPKTTNLSVYRKRYTSVIYPSREQWIAAGYDPLHWDEDLYRDGFTFSVLANQTGYDERREFTLRFTYLREPSDANREAFRREIASRIPEWNFATENAAGKIVTINGRAQNGQPDYADEAGEDVFNCDLMLTPSVLTADDELQIVFT